MRAPILAVCTLASSAAAFTSPRTSDVATVRTTRLRESGGGERPPVPAAAMDTDEASDYEYDPAEFADYSSDYSDVDDGGGMADGELADGLDLGLYDDYEAIGGYDLTPFEKHARDVFLAYSQKYQSSIDHDVEDLSSKSNDECEDTLLQNAAIAKDNLYEMLRELDIEASEEETKALFKYLDVDDSGIITLDEVSVFLCIRNSTTKQTQHTK